MKSRGEYSKVSPPQHSLPPPPTPHRTQSKRAINMYLAIDLSSSFRGLVVMVCVCVCFPTNTTPESYDKLPLLRISPFLSTKLYLLQVQWLWVRSFCKFGLLIMPPNLSVYWYCYGLVVTNLRPLGSPLVGFPLMCPFCSAALGSFV